MKKLFLTMLLLHLSGMAAASTRTGNGGDGSKAQDFVRAAYKFIALFEQLPLSEREGLKPEEWRQVLGNAFIKAVTKCDALGPDGKIFNPTVCNFPDAVPQRIEVTDLWKEQSELEKIGLAGHELAGLLGLETNDYNLTARLIDKFGDLSLPQAAQVSLPVLLEQMFVDSDREGFSAAEVSRYCDKMRRLHLNEYFYVYCHTVRKQWQETWTDAVKVPGYQFLGYETVHSHSSATASVFGLYSHAAAASYHQRPVLRRIQNLVPLERIENHQAFGVKIYGLGRFDRDMPIHLWPHTLLRSDQLVAVPDADNDQDIILHSLTFPSARAAYQTCVISLRTAMRKENAKYFRSNCAVGSLETGEWYFAIKTQNPFHHEEF